MTNRRLISTLSLGAALGAVALCWPDPAGPAAGADAAMPAPTPGGPPDQIEAARAQPPAVPQVTFPDGTRLPVLNGVTEPVALDWPGDRPYSPVVDTVRDGDTEWFLHADGSWSTTLRRKDEVSGRYVTLCPLYQPGPTKPVSLRSQ